MVLALSAHGIAACLTDRQGHHGQGLVVVAHLTLSRGPGYMPNERRFTWRGLFASQPAQLYGLDPRGYSPRRGPDKSIDCWLPSATVGEL
jgi:hypothetical protein